MVGWFFFEYLATIGLYQVVITVLIDKLVMRKKDPGFLHDCAENVLHGNMDDSTEGILPTTQEDDNFAQFQEVETDTKEGSARVSTETALLGHRDEYGFAPNDGCRTRVRLTPSEPSKAGAMWHARPLAVFLGFETKFTFQITDQSRTCTSPRRTRPPRVPSSRHHAQPQLAVFPWRGGLCTPGWLCGAVRQSLWYDARCCRQVLRRFAHG